MIRRVGNLPVRWFGLVPYREDGVEGRGTNAYIRSSMALSQPHREHSEQCKGREAISQSRRERAFLAKRKKNGRRERKKKEKKEALGRVSISLIFNISD